MRDNGAVRSPADDSATQNRAQLVIFDLDGTLTDSAAGVVASFRHALAAIGAEPPPGDLAARVVGPPLAQTMVTLGLGDRAEEAVAAYRADYTSRGWAMNALYDGIADLSLFDAKPPLTNHNGYQGYLTSSVDVLGRAYRLSAEYKF